MTRWPVGPRTLGLLPLALFAPALALLAPGCIPYAVTSTAHTVPPGRIQPSGIVYGVPGGAELLREDFDADGWRDLPTVGLDAEVRIGLDERSDLGVRILPGYGILGNYKRRIVGSADGTTPAFAVMAGFGFLNLFNHLHGELTLIGSGPLDSFTPYGGLRVMQVVPLADGAPHDDPTAGGFVGVRIGRFDLAIVPEVGWYWDRSALGLRNEDQIWVFAVGLEGVEFLEALGVIARIIPFLR